MFKTYADYVQAATAELRDKPKGTGYQNGTGVVFLLAGVLHYAADGDGIEDAVEGDVSEWIDPSNRAEFAALQQPVFAERFTPAEVETSEADMRG